MLAITANELFAQTNSYLINCIGKTLKWDGKKSHSSSFMSLHTQMYCPIRGQQPSWARTPTDARETPLHIPWSHTPLSVQFKLLCSALDIRVYVYGTRPWPSCTLLATHWAAQWLSQNMCVLWFYLYRKLNRECFTHIPKCSNAAMAIDTQNVFIEIVKCVLWHDHAYAQKCPINLEIVVDCGQCLLPGEWSSKTMKCLIHFDLFILFIHILLLLLLLFSASFRFSTFSVYCTWIELARRMHIV